MVAPIITAAVAWLHFFAAIAWMGSVMTFGMVIGPTLRDFSAPGRMEFFAKVGPRYVRFSLTFGLLTLVSASASRTCSLVRSSIR